MGNLDVSKACCLEFLLEDCSAHSGGSHACVASKYDLVKSSEVDFAAVSRCSISAALALGSSLHIAHLSLCIFKAAGVGHLHDRRSDQEGNSGADQEAEDDHRLSAFGSNCEQSQDGTGRSRAHKADIEDRVEEHCRYGTADGSKEQQGVHQNIREVDLVDTAEYVHDQSAGSGILGCLVIGEHPVSEQDACACAGVGLDHVEHGLAERLDLLRSERSEDTVVDRVVEEQDLRRLDENRDQRKESCIDQDVNAARQEYQNACHKRSDQVEAYDREQHAQDTDGEVVDQHLEACRNLAFDRLVEFLDDPAAQRARQHSAHQHGIIGSAADNADAGDRAHDRASCAADHLTAGIGDQDGQDVGQHRADHGRQLLIRQPAGRDEKRCDESPCDEGADVRHDHTAEEPSEGLNSFFHCVSPFKTNNENCYFDILIINACKVTNPQIQNEVCHTEK